MVLGAGDDFAGYRIERALGAGGMGEVYLAQHPRLPRPYALKVLAPGLTDDPDFRERFNREAEAAATLWHPHIVGVHDRGESEGRLWIAMDYVEGTDAAELLRASPNGLAVTEVVEIITAVADALDYAHERRLLHRDVKPANVLLTTGDRRRILLGDFGIARHADDISGLTATNAVIGTVAYAAPEQLTGRPLDERADQYSLAATAFHLLTGRPPFADSNPAVVIGMHLTSSPPPLSTVRPDLAHLDEVFACALAKEPGDRYPRCADFARVLASAASGVSTSAPAVPPLAFDAPVTTPWNPPVYPVYPVASQRKSHRVIRVVVPILLLVLLAGAATFATTQFLRPIAPTPNAQWQPYVDSAKSFTALLMSINADNAERDVDRILDRSTGDFREELGKNRSGFLDTVRQAGATTEATVTGAGLESVDGPTAIVLVAATSRVTSIAGANNQPRSWRLRLTMVEVDDTFKASKVEFVP